MRFFASWWDRLRGSTTAPTLVSVVVLAGLLGPLARYLHVLARVAGNVWG